MSCRLAITGEPGVGKSTLVQRVLARTKLRYGGILTKEVRVSGRRTGFELIDLHDGRRAPLADEKGQGPRLGRYHVNIHNLEEIGVRALKSALEADLIVVDEVGPMELLSERFAETVYEAIASGKSMLVVLHKRSNHPLAKHIRESFTLLEVSKENRDALVEYVLREIEALAE